jgi:hypothetical protein
VVENCVIILADWTEKSVLLLSLKQGSNLSCLMKRIYVDGIGSEWEAEGKPGGDC